MLRNARTHTVEVPTRPDQVSIARKEVREVLTGWGIQPGLVEDTVLVLSELAANVVRHAAHDTPTTRIEVGCAHGAVTLAVTDRCASRPRRQRRPRGRSGRGLLLVQGIAHEAGGSMSVAAVPGGGKTITIRLPGARV